MKRKSLALTFAVLLVLPLLFFGLTACGTKEVQKQGLSEEERARLAAEERMRQQRLREMELARQGYEIFESEMVHFDYDQYNIRSDAAEVLQRKAQYMRQNPGLIVQVQGHCDERGTDAYNMALGDRRAHSAKKYMMDLGVNSHRMTTVSYGEEMPLDPSANEYAWALNRRAQFEISGK